MSNINTGSITGFAGIVPGHLQAGGGARTAARAIQQDTNSAIAPLFDSTALKSSYNGSTASPQGLDWQQELVHEFDVWIGGIGRDLHLSPGAGRMH